MLNICSKQNTYAKICTTKLTVIICYNLQYVVCIHIQFVAIKISCAHISRYNAVRWEDCVCYWMAAVLY